MRQFIQHLRDIANSLGGPGLALLAFADSSFITLPEIPDAMLIALAAQFPAWWPYFAAMATAGSIIGCYIIYAIARKGGEAFLRRRLDAKHIDRGMRMFNKFGLLTVVVPSILPPPMPFKPFVLLAGVAQVRPVTFIVALVIGRGFRYSIEGLLAAIYGEAAAEWIKQNIGRFSLWFAAAVVVLGVIAYIWRRRQQQSNSQDAG
jgi:membrane protein YqaA with SNARE-associated domain